MGRPSKFTEARKEQIIAVLKVGGSRDTAAQVAGVTGETLRVWLKRGEGMVDDEDEEQESAYAEFYERVLAAEAEPRFRALGIVYKALPDKPELAWKVIERKEPGYAAPMPGAKQVAPAVQINLSLAGSSAPMPSWIEGEVVDAEEVPALSDGGGEPDPASPDQS